MRNAFLAEASTSAGCFATFASVLQNPNEASLCYCTCSVQNMFNTTKKHLTFFPPSGIRSQTTICSLPTYSIAGRIQPSHSTSSIQSLYGSSGTSFRRTLKRRYSPTLLLQGLLVGVSKTVPVDMLD